MMNDIFTVILIIILIYKSIEFEVMGLFSQIGQAFDSAANKAEKV